MSSINHPKHGHHFPKRQRIKIISIRSYRQQSLFDRLLSLQCCYGICRVTWSSLNRTRKYPQNTASKIVAWCYFWFALFRIIRWKRGWHYPNVSGNESYIYLVLMEFAFRKAQSEMCGFFLRDANCIKMCDWNVAFTRLVTGWKTNRLMFPTPKTTYY